MAATPRPRDPAGSPSAPPARRRSAVAVLGERNFAPYFVGNLLSNCGTWFQNIAQTLLVYRLTHSPFLVGVVNFAQFAGVLLLGPWAGAAADRFDRRRLVVLTQLLAMLVTGGLAAAAALGRASVPLVIALALVLGLTTAFATPAMQALLPSLVRREDLAHAVAMTSVTFNLARAVGPVAGAAVVARFGVAWAFAVNALSFAALIAGLLVVRPAPREPVPRGRARLRDSLRELRAQPWIALLLAIVAAVSVTIDPVNTLSPAFATRVFGRRDTLAGALIGAFGAGAVAASLAPVHPPDHAHRGRAARTVALALAALALGMAGFALAPTLPLAFAALAVAGAGFLLAQTRATALLQLGVDDRQRGRVMALWGIAFLGSRPIASVLDGGLATLVGPRVATLGFVAPAAVAAVGALAWARRAGDRAEEGAGGHTGDPSLRSG